MCWILQNAFPESTVLRLSLSCSFFLYSIDTLYDIIDFHMLNQPCISEMNLSCGISFFLNAARFSLLVFCWGHLHLFIRDLLFSHSVLSDSLWPHRLWPPGSSVHGISQARILEGLLFPPPGNPPHPGIEPACPTL